MQPQPPKDCEVALTLNNTYLWTESFLGFVTFGLVVLYLKLFSCCHSLQLFEFSNSVLIFAPRGVARSSSVLMCQKLSVDGNSEIILL